MSGSSNTDPILSKIQSGWKLACADKKFKKGAKWLRLFVQYTKTSAGVPEEFQPRAQEMIDFLVKELDNIDDKSTPDVILAIKFARRQLKTRVAYGSGFSQTLTDEERKRAQLIGKPIVLNFQGIKREVAPADNSGDAVFDNYLGSDESELD
jgi:hypothetical protein